MNKKSALLIMERDQNNIPIITEEYLKEYCESQGQYRTPHLNDSLNLTHRGIQKIQNLNSYFNLKAIYLSENIISKIENLEALN